MNQSNLAATMLHQNDYIQKEMIRHRQGKLLAEARLTRIRKNSDIAGHRFRERFLLSMAEVLILSGKKLKGRYEPHYLRRDIHVQHER